jgi:hypothetical protein
MLLFEVVFFVEDIYLDIITNFLDLLVLRTREADFEVKPLDARLAKHLLQ